MKGKVKVKGRVQAMGNIRFGIIGTSGITHAFMEAAGQTQQIEITAIYSRDEERGRQAALTCGAAHVYTELEALAQSAVVDAVYIASPNACHAAQAIRLMQSGKHVLCEKPIAANARELQQMIEAARAHGVLLMEAMMSTLLPNHRMLPELLPRIGKVRRYFASYCQYSSRYDALKAGTVLNAFKPELANGALVDIGVYCLYPLVVLFGEPLAIKANALMLPTGVDGEGSLLLHYADMEAVVIYSKITNSALPSEIQGEDGTLVLDRINIPSKVELHVRGGASFDVSRPQEKHNMYYELQEFVSCMRAGRSESDVNTHARSLAVMHIMDEARRQIGLVYPADLP